MAIAVVTNTQWNKIFSPRTRPVIRKRDHSPRAKRARAAKVFRLRPAGRAFHKHNGPGRKRVSKAR